MSWTDSTTIKKHLMQSGITVGEISNEEHTLRGEDSVQLGNALITETSEEVKTIDLSEPYDEGGVVLIAYTPASLDHSDLVENSVVVADDIHRSEVYIEGTDYVIDYELGKIRRVPGSSISSGATAYIWYLYFTVHVRDTDYTIDYEAGTIARIDGGGIADSGIVYVDYETSATTVSDSLIAEAITEAEDKILARLSSEYSGSSTDQGLRTGATELSLAIICNAKSMDIMNKTLSPAADDMAKQWRMASLRYEEQAWRTLSRFLAKPALSPARIKQNQSFDR